MDGQTISIVIHRCVVVSLDSLSSKSLKIRTIIEEESKDSSIKHLFGVVVVIDFPQISVRFVFCVVPSMISESRFAYVLMFDVVRVLGYGLRNHEYKFLNPIMSLYDLF